MHRIDDPNLVAIPCSDFPQSNADVFQGYAKIFPAVGGHQVRGLIEQCGRRGIPAAVAIAAGFSETGAHGAELERDLARVADDSRVTLIGPNCMGLISNERQLHATGFIVLHPRKGKLSFASQSGNIGTQIVDACERRGIGIDKFISVGNEAQVSAIDVLDYLRNDRMATAVAPLSPRARKGATVSMPVDWSQVRVGLDPKKFTVRMAPSLLRKNRPWKDYPKSAKPLRQAIEQLLKTR